MAIPDFQSFLLPLLRLVALDGPGLDSDYFFEE
jgi:hypothetical protein